MKLRKRSALTVALVFMLTVAALLALPVSAANGVISSIPNIPYTPTADDGSTTLPDPVIMSFEDATALAKNARFTNHKDNKTGVDEAVEGTYRFVTLDDGTGCLQLDYCDYVYGSYSPYRTMPAFNRENNTNAAGLTADHKYVRITYMTTDDVSNTITLTNNANGTSTTIVKDTSISDGKWARSNAVDISDPAKNILGRYVDGIHCTIEYNSTDKNSRIYIKELAFFASEEQAYSYYNDEPGINEMDFSVMTFNVSGTATTSTGYNGEYNWGEQLFDLTTGSLDLLYVKDPGTNFVYNNERIRYMAKVKFKDSKSYDPNNVYMRVLYSANDLGELSGNAALYIRNDGISSQVFCVEDEITDTNGKFVLTEPCLLYPEMAARFDNTNHNSLFFNTTADDNKYSIKAVYFFPTEFAAKYFYYDDSPSEVTVNGVSITDYQIVITEDAPIKVEEAAEALQFRINELTGEVIEIVRDSEDEGEYEILVGQSNRKLSTEYVKNLDYREYAIAMDDTTLVITSEFAPVTKAAVEAFMEDCLYSNLQIPPKNITIPSDLDISGTYTTFNQANPAWELRTNVSDPERFVDRFTENSGFWTEESNGQDWTVSGGTYNTVADDLTLSYIHVYETDVEYNLKIKYTEAGNNSDMGLMLRYNSDAAWVKAGYDFERESWYIKSREGADFYSLTLDEAEMELDSDTMYDLKFVVDGTQATLYVDGEEMLCTDNVSHLSPGRIAVYAENAAVSVDDADIYLLSGEGTVMKDIVHTKLPVDEYIEGGTVVEMTDGTLVYQHHYGHTFKSLDGGQSWDETTPYFPISGYMNILRLIDGGLIQVVAGSNAKVAKISYDEGATWTQLGDEICQSPFGGDTTLNASAGNMNDKITQGPTGTIYYCQNYETKNADGFTDDTVDENGNPVKRMVFCEFFYYNSDEKAWVEMGDGSWNIPGNETETHFGECKILECDDGTIRMYNSWNDYGCIVYSDYDPDTDTWGELQFMDDFPCSRSSMQFVRDVYADDPYTYYMVWVNDAEPGQINAGMPRSRLTLAKSNNGKDWEVLGDIWRWESGYMRGNAMINHVVDPFIQVTKDYLLVGSGFSEHMGLITDSTTSNWHQAQRQHIYSIKKGSLGADLPPVVVYADADGDGEVMPADLAIFQRYLAKWIGYDEETYDFSRFDLNGDDRINSIDSAVLARHMAGWSGYETIPIG